MGGSQRSEGGESLKKGAVSGRSDYGEGKEEKNGSAGKGGTRRIIALVRRRSIRGTVCDRGENEKSWRGNSRRGRLAVRGRKDKKEAGSQTRGKFLVSPTLRKKGQKMIARKERVIPTLEKKGRGQWDKLRGWVRGGKGKEKDGKSGLTSLVGRMEP